MKKLWPLLLLLSASAWGSGIYNPGSTGAGGGGGIVSPGTFTWTNPNGMTAPDTAVSTGVVNFTQLSYANNNNILINGGMEFYQRGASFSVGPSTAVYTLDRWKTFMQGSGWVATISSSTVQTDTQKSSMAIIRTSSGGSGTPAITMKQAVENYYDFVGSSVTIYARVYQTTTNDTPYVQVTDSGGNCNTSGQATATGQWITVSCTRFIPANATSLTVELITFISFQNNPIYWDSLMLVRGSAAIPFNPRPVQQELALCQRYYQKSFDIATAPGTAGDTNAETVVGATVGSPGIRSSMAKFIVTMRVAPTVVLYCDTDGAVGKWGWESTGGAFTDRTTTAQTIGTRGFNVTQSGANDLWGFGQWTADAEM